MTGPDLHPEPDFIAFLFSPKPKFDCYFMVGEKSLVEPVRFGAVKMMLIAHSVVFKAELEDSELKEKGDIAVKDVYPDTFKTLLKFIYGYDTTADLTFDEADNMFYAAEKYMMPNLKKKLALRLIALLTPDNVCSLLNNPVCYTQLQLHAKITQILRYETDKVLASPHFVDVCTEGVVSILEQDGLAVPEIELWRAAIKWAVQKADTDVGHVLRQQMTKLTKHLRICTLSQKEFNREVAPLKVLSPDEESAVSVSIKNQEKQEHLTTICNEIQPRKRLQRPDSKVEGYKLFLLYHKKLSTLNEITFMPVSIKASVIELMPLECIVKMQVQDGITSRLNQLFASTCQVDCKITVTRINTTFKEPPVLIQFSERVIAGQNFKIPLTIGGDNVRLCPNSKYIVKVWFVNNQMMCETCILRLYFTK